LIQSASLRKPKRKPTQVEPGTAKTFCGWVSSSQPWRSKETNGLSRSVKRHGARRKTVEPPGYPARTARQPASSGGVRKPGGRRTKKPPCRKVWWDHGLASRAWLRCSRYLPEEDGSELLAQTEGSPLYEGPLSLSKCESRGRRWGPTVVRI